MEGEMKFTPEEATHTVVRSIEEKQACIDAHIDSIQTIASSELLYTLKNGTVHQVDGVRMETVFRSGKQQPVAIVRLTFPKQTSFEIVLRPTGQTYESLYQQYESVRTYFPHIFFSSSEQDESKTVLALERVEGYDEKLDSDAFEKCIAIPRNFEKLCQEMFHMVDELFHDPIVLTDIIPTSGHNVMYDTQTDTFRLFDIDTVYPSDLDFEKKFISFIDRGQTMNDKEIQYFMRMIQLYLEKYPDTQLSYEDGEEVRNQYIIAQESVEGGDNVIYPDNPQYEGVYRAIDWRGTRGRTDLPPLTLVQKRGKYINSVNRELLEAVKQNDFEKVKEISTRLEGKILEKIFVEIEE